MRYLNQEWAIYNLHIIKISNSEFTRNKAVHFYKHQSIRSRMQLKSNIHYLPFIQMPLMFFMVPSVCFLNSIWSHPRISVNSSQISIITCTIIIKKNMRIPANWYIRSSLHHCLYIKFTFTNKLWVVVLTRQAQFLK